MDANGLLTQQHYVAHFIMQDQVLAEIPRERLTERPVNGGNSVAWLLWHATRCEDLAVNVIIRQGEQVLTSGGFSAQPGLNDDRIGTGFGDEQVASFCESVDIDALIAYQQAVRDDTARWLRTLDPNTLDAKPDLAAILDKLDLFPAAGQWVRDLWEPWPASIFLNWVAIGHTYMHIGEMQTVKAALGIPGR